MAGVLRNVLLGISLAAPLGPAGVAVIQNGLQRGFARALATGIGVTLADATYLLVVYLGLAGLIGRPAVKVLIWTGGALALVYLGVQSIREAGRRLDLEAKAPATSRSPLLVGYLVNISNPLAAVWWLGVFGSLLGASAGGQAPPAALLEGSTILAGILLWHATVSLLTHWGKRFLNARVARYISLAAGIALILFGARFAYSALVTALAGVRCYTCTLHLWYN